MECCRLSLPLSSSITAELSASDSIALTSVGLRPLQGRTRQVARDCKGCHRTRDPVLLARVRVVLYDGEPPKRSRDGGSSRPAHDKWSVHNRQLAPLYVQCIHVHRDRSSAPPLVTDLCTAHTFHELLSGKQSCFAQCLFGPARPGPTLQLARRTAGNLL